jgi:hypothetical protein
LLALCCVLVLWAAAAAIWPLHGQVVPWDSKNHFYPMLRYLGQSLANGEWPLWNPYHFSGHPAVADPQSLLFTPTMLLFGWLDPTPTMQEFDLAVFAHFLIGASAIVFLFRRRGWHWLGAVLAATIFILGGSASARLQHTGMIFSYSFFPLALLLLEEILDRRSVWLAVPFAIVAALMAVGRDQVAFLFCLTLIFAVAYPCLTVDKPLAWLKARVLPLAVAAFVGAALLAVPALLTIQFLSDSNRPEIAYDIAIMGSLPPSSLATALFANVFGSLRDTYDYWGPGTGTLPEGSWTDRSINYVFAGTIPALLLLWHGIAGGRLLAREFRFFLIVGLAALVYALGRYTPLFTLLFHHVPGVDLYRRPADATFQINIALAFAAGYLLHRFLRDGLPRPVARVGQWSALALSGGAVVLTGSALYVAVKFALPADRLTLAMQEVGLGLALAAGGALVFIVARNNPTWRYAAAIVLVAVTGVELIKRDAGSALNAEPHSRYAVFETLPAEQVRGLQILKKELDVRHARGERPRIEILGLGGAWQNASMVFGLEDTLGYNPLRIADYARAVGPGENAADASLREFPGTFKNYRCRLASLLGLEYLVLDKPIEQMPKRFPRLPNANLIYGTGSMWIYKFPPTMPRAYLATRLIPVDSEAVLQNSDLPDFDRNGSALVEEAQTEELTGDYGLKDQTTHPAPAHGTVIIRGYRRNAIVIDVDTDRRAMLVLHDLYYPGWVATIDDKEVPILRANLLFRGIEVPPGHHRVHFQFRPLSVSNLVAAANDLIKRTEDENDSETPGEPAKASAVPR